MRIAVIGTGISGNLAARLLSDEHDLHVYEANDYIGGHSHTMDVQVGGSTYAIDTGFMVFNQRTYPNFCRMLRALRIPSRDSDMSFSVSSARSGLEYQGSSLNGLFAQRSNLASPRFVRMLADIVRFNRRATRYADRGDLPPSWTVADLFNDVGVSSAFIDDYFVPMASAIWSASPESILSFPAHFMVGFCRNHGLLQLVNRPQWKTIPGGARTYVDALTTPILDRYRLNSPVASVTRTDDHVVVTTAEGETDIFDQVVFATHADQTLRILQDATEQESRLLSAFPYQPNIAIVHTDTNLLPRRRAAWASWNYRVPSDGRQAASVTYDLSRLQGHDSSKPILLTLNPVDTIKPEQILRELHYDHPAYSIDSVRAQERLGEINGQRRAYFCGAYWGYGFHEDGVNSALAVARCFGKSLDQLESSQQVVETEDFSSLR